MRRGFRVKITISFLTLVIILVVLINFIYIYQQNRLLKEEVEKRGRSVIQALLVPCSIAVVNAEYDTIDRYMADFRGDKGKKLDLAYLMVLDNKGAVVSHTDSSEFGAIYGDKVSKRAIESKETLVQEYFNLDLKESVMDISTPISIANQRWGTLRIGLSLETVKNRLSSIIWKGIVISVLFLFLSVILGILVSKKLARPISELSIIAKDITKTKNMNRKIEIRSGDEIEELAECFNEMICSIGNYISEIERREVNLKSAIAHFGSVLSKASSGILTAKVDLASIPDEYKPIGKDINKMVEETKKREDELLKIADETIFVMENIGSGNYEYHIDSSKYELPNIQLVAETMNAVVEHLKKSNEELRLLLKEIVTPTIEVTKGVLVMPLVGQLTNDRLLDVTETLQKKLANMGSRVGIIDVTGLLTIDSTVINNLLKILKNVKQMGVTPILTGISPDTIANLAKSGVEFDFVTKTTLLEGLEYATKLS